MQWYFQFVGAANMAAGKILCKFYGTAKGCSSGSQCKFIHGTSNAALPSVVTAGGGGPPITQNDSEKPCKFFGSAKGCSSSENCQFSHSFPNSVPPCSFKQRLGHCERGEACTYRHVPWGSEEHARAHYASRGNAPVELSTARYKQLHRDTGTRPRGKTQEAPLATRLATEQLEMSVEVEVEREVQLETYGSTAMKMMERMGYKPGVGLGKQETGDTKLVDPCLALEQKSASCALGFGNFCGEAKLTAAERAARLAEARAKKRQRVSESTFVVHNLLDDDDSDSDDDVTHKKARDVNILTK